ncbi:tripartite tricarboxylate transporter TctB family protein [Clostridium algidicarnis]|uniref:tripartite tricarboxylate transporter TctB family protein n=1 Tax=Clostridium algidicarnis TaxID=37659 RepID=UPI001C0B90E6|nr:tripartite tricarboxylate transporter TctB family protein [Clostridium algidicarnis]MBU3208063.1 tripartite tricarboxylate transporter TctB family protein [Clostridium algidicarnis]
MKYTGNKKVILFICAFIFLLIYGGNGKTVSAEPIDEDIEITVEYGFDGRYKIGNNIPIFIEVKNGNKDIEGELQIKFPTTQNQYNIYSQAINLPKESTKNFIMAIPFMDISNEIEVLIEQNNKPLGSTKVRIENGRLLQNQKLVGVLSEDFSSLSYFNNIKIQGNDSNKGLSNSNILELDTVAVKLTKDNIGENYKSLDALDILVIDNFDTSVLSRNQYGAIKEWVESGKVLVIGAGSNYSKTLSLFKDGFINAEIVGTETKTLNSLNKYIDDYSTGTLNGEVLNINIKDSEVLLKEGNTPIVSKLSKKDGVIILSGIDLGIEPFIGWSSRDVFISKLISSNMPNVLKEVGSEGRQNNYNLNNILNTVPKEKLPNIRNISILFVVYIMIIGPLGYFILKRFNKRDYIWVTVPVMALAFSLFIYVIGSTTRINKPFSNLFSITIMEDKDSIETKVYSSIISPSKNNLYVEEPEGVDLEFINDPDQYNRNTGLNEENKKLNLKVIYDGNKTYFEFQDMKPFKLNSFNFNKKDVVLNELKSNLKFKEGKLQGEIVNTLDTDLESLYIISPFSIYELGDLKKGDTLDVKNVIKEYKNIDDLTRAFHMNPNATNNDRNKISQLEILFERMNIYGKNENDQNTYIIGSSKDMIKDKIKVNGNEVVTYQNNLIAFKSNISFIEDGIVEYPYGLLKPSLDNKLGQGDYDEGRGAIYGNMSLNLTYKIKEDINIDIIRFKNTESLDYSSSFNGNFYILNIDEDKYEKMGISGADINIENPSRYVKNGQIKVRLENSENKNNDGRPSSVPLMSIKGGVK